MTRSEAYTRLAKLMEMSVDDCHIANMTAEQCRRVVTLSLKLALDQQQGAW